jgi:hypothetical protein
MLKHVIDMKKRMGLLGCNVMYVVQRQPKRFRDIYCLHLQGQRASQARNQQKLVASRAQDGATCYVAWTTLDMPKKFSGDGIVATGSLDLTSPNFMEAADFQERYCTLFEV